MKLVLVARMVRRHAGAMMLSGAVLAACCAAQAEENVAPQPQSTPAAVAVSNPKLDRALLENLSKGRWEDALQALSEGANPNARGKDGMTALMLAAQGGRPDIVSTLLERGAQANLTNKAGQTALHLAATIGQPKPKKRKFGGLGKMLGGAVLGGGLGELGDKAGFASALLGGGGLDGLLGDNLKGLLQNGVLNLGGTSGWKAIIGTALQGDLKSGGALGIENLLAGSGLDASGWIGLLSAVKGSNAEVFSAMGKLAGDAGVENSEQWTQFLSAATTGDKSAVESLMANEEFSPLLQQAMQGFSSAAGELPANAAKNIVVQLLQKGADSKLVDKEGRTVAELAQARGWEQVVALLEPGSAAAQEE